MVAAIAVVSSCLLHTSNVQLTSAFQPSRCNILSRDINRHHHHHYQSCASPTILQAVSKRQVSVLDGAELHSVERFLAEENGSTEKPLRSGVPRLGFLTVVAGTAVGEGEGDANLYAGKRVVGVEIAAGDAIVASSTDAAHQDESSSSSSSSSSSALSLGDGVNLHKDSVAVIPDGVSDTDAIATMMASLSAVHCALPISENVGGSADASIISGKAVVVGGGEYATFAADALATLGADVYQVSTGKPKPTNTNGELRHDGEGGLYDRNRTVYF